MISDAVQNMEVEENAEWNAQKDIFISQGIGWLDDGVMDAFTARYANFRSRNPKIKLIYYFEVTGVRKPAFSGGVGYSASLYDMLTSAVRGSSDWFLTDKDGLKVESQFDPTRENRVNSYCTQFQATNSLGRKFDEQFLTEVHESFSEIRPAGKMLDFADGLFFDVVPPAAQKVFVDGSNGATESGADYNKDGSNDGRFNETDGGGNEDLYGGARMHRRGAASWITTFNNIFGTEKVLLRNGSKDGLDYDFDLFEPIVNSVFYQAWDGGIHENAQLALGIKKVGSAYDVSFNGFETFCRRQQRQKSSFKTTSVWGEFGPHCLITEAPCVNRTPIAIDFDYARFIGGLCALNGSCFGVSRGKRTPFPPLDEYIIAWGSAIDPAHPNIGILDLTNTGNPFTLRSPDFSSGSADFWWVEFDNIIWIVRGDFPANGVGSFGSGSTVACTLPSAGVGKKWIHPDLSAHTNATSGFTTRAQNNSLNDGSDAGSTVSLLPAHAVLLAREDA